MESHIATLGIDFKIKTIDLNGQKVKLQIWDTAGEERFRAITQSLLFHLFFNILAYYRNAMGVLIVYDVTSAESFANVPDWIRQVQMHADAEVSQIIIGNKSDEEAHRRVTYEQGKALAERNGFRFVETSAKSGLNVGQAFEVLSEDVVGRLVNILEQTEKLNLAEEKKMKRERCCH